MYVNQIIHLSFSTYSSGKRSLKLAFINEISILSLILLAFFWVINTMKYFIHTNIQTGSHSGTFTLHTFTQEDVIDSNSNLLNALDGIQTRHQELI